MPNMPLRLWLRVLEERASHIDAARRNNGFDFYYLIVRRLLSVLVTLENVSDLTTMSNGQCIIPERPLNGGEWLSFRAQVAR